MDSCHDVPYQSFLRAYNISTLAMPSQKGRMTLVLDKERLLTKLNEMKARFPWYKQLLVNSDTEDIETLPLLTTDQLERYYYAEEPSDASQLSVYRTSGTSSGKRKSIYYSQQDDEHYIRIKADIYRSWLEQAGIQRALADMGTGHAASTSLAIFEQLGWEGKAISFELPIEQHLAELSAVQPDLLYTMPSILEQIVCASDNPSAYGIKRIILVGELASMEWQRRMAERFGIQPEHIMDTYGSIEIGTIAYYSHEHGRYLLTEGLFAEGVSAKELDYEADELLPDEQVLVLTSFVRTVFPALRYVTYDVVRGLETILIDGKPRQTFRCLSKRIGSELKHGEKISLYDIEEVVYAHVSDAEMKVQLINNALVVLLKSKSLNESAAALIRADLQNRIPEIGSMIRNRLLRSIEVRNVGADEAFERGKIKKKKIYDEGSR